MIIIAETRNTRAFENSWRGHKYHKFEESGDMRAFKNNGKYPIGRGTAPWKRREYWRMQEYHCH
jgi:hypothetical protein